VTALVLRTRGGGFSVRVPMRPVLVGMGLAAVTAALAVVAIGTGDYSVSPGEVIDTLLGGGSRATSFIIETLRLPRVLCAVLVGIALGISGAMFQSLTNNPLGSPDIVGFTTGSAVGALFVITVLGGSGLQVSGGALAGGLVTAVLVYGLAFKRGVSGYRLVLIGIGISALAMAAIDYLLTRARIEEAVAATVWLVGSLNGRGWDQVRPLAGALVVLVPAALLLARPLRLLEMGDDSARALGLRRARADRDRARRGRARGRGDDRRRPHRVRGARGPAARAAARAAPQPRHRDLGAHGRGARAGQRHRRAAPHADTAAGGAHDGTDRRRVPGLVARR
jgi:iron complex transport system permease protein